MFFGDAESSQFDLHWRMFGIDVRVSPWFWVVSALFGWSWIDRGFEYVLLWIACVFVSILIHELGHVLMGRLFGTSGRIFLHSFGGLAIDCSHLRQRWQRVFVYAAGPGAGFLFFALVAGLYIAMGKREPDGLDRAALYMLFFINLYWGFVNLLPVQPLDGGQISREFFTWIMPRNGQRVALGVSALVGGLIAVYAMVGMNSPYLAAIFGIMALQSYTAMQPSNRPY